MNEDIRSILASLDEFERTEEGLEMELRMSIAALLLRHLDAKGWSQRELAEKAAMKAPQLNRILHGDANCQLGTIAKLLHALSIHAEIQEVGAAAAAPLEEATAKAATIAKQDFTRGQTIESSKNATGITSNSLWAATAGA